MSNGGGTESGTLEEVRVDAKKRVILPEDVRRKSGVKTGSRLMVSAKDGSTILTKSVSPEEFIQGMEGLLKDDSPVRATDPIKLKEIWSAS